MKTMPARTGRIISVAALLICLPLSPAFATNKISSPDITRGQIELEYRGGYDMDNTRAKDAQFGHKFVANYGLTDRWRMEAKLDAAGHAGNVDWTYLEYSNRFQLLKSKQDWMGLSVQANYKVALQGPLPDKLEFTILANKDTGPFSHVTNINFENEVGDHAQGKTDINLGWKTKYRLDPRFEPGAEFYADFGKMGANVKDKYQVGPVFYGKIGGVKYDVGYLVSLNSAAPNGRIKYILTYAF